MAEEVKINDGNGLYDKFGLIDSCAKDLCSIKVRVDEIATTGYLIADIISRLNALAKGLKEDDEREEKNGNGTKSDPGGWNHV